MVYLSTLKSPNNDNDNDNNNDNTNDNNIDPGWRRNDDR
jgi:hypothetical protein